MLTSSLQNFGFATQSPIFVSSNTCPELQFPHAGLCDEAKLPPLRCHQGD